MEIPLQGLRIEDPDNHSPRDSGSQMAEGLFTSETGIQSKDADPHQPPNATPVVELSPFQRRAIFGDGLRLQKRAEATVTVAASQVVVNVNDGLSTVLATTIPTLSTDSILSLSDLGSVTIPANLTSISTVTQPDTSRTLGEESSSSTTVEFTTSTLSSTSSLSSGSLNGTLTDSITSVTVTVTETSTLEVSYLNGTLFPVVVATVIEGESSTEIESSQSNTATGLIVTEDDSNAATTSPGVGDSAGTVGATPTAEAPAATSSQSSGAGGGGGPTLSPQEQQVVGGVVGSVAGVALILVFVLFLLRRYRVKLKAQGRLPEQIAERTMLEGGDGPPRMSQRSSAIPLTATIASSLRRFRPPSSQTQATDFTASTMPENERGFQKIAGRKIAPVLSTGGDGYGGDYGAFSKETGADPSSHHRNESSLADASFYRDSRGFYGGRGTDSPTYPPSPTVGTGEENIGPSSTRDFAGRSQHSPSDGSLVAGRPEGTAALRPSPARTPVTVSPAPSSIRLPIHQTPDLADAPPMPSLAPGLYASDGIGRTLASQDGSRISARSRGSARSRFAENV